MVPDDNMEDRPHSDRSYDEQLKMLQQRLSEMGNQVEQQLAAGIRAVVQRDSGLAKQTIDGDRVVDRMDVEIEELCVRLLALRQPAARDLRFITTALKINADLERIGDLTTSIAQCAHELNSEPPLLPLIDIPRLADIVQRMVRESLDAFVRADSGLALTVCAADDEIDALNSQWFRILLSYMAENPQTITRVIRLSFVSKCLERIADHAQNIAEKVVFMVKGKSIRHLDSLPGAAPTLG
ncbi:MAG TPA: phosphate signaling complex protein PhoU [Candidatus Acidoferrales bacterium]|nr:phosphate signaling complex protein PhoU [Candidatus Acidoferrales bacterium]